MSKALELWPNGVPSFGKEMRQEFILGTRDGQNNVAFCNHGSYGATPKIVMDERVNLLMEVENFPDLWYRKNEAEKYNKALDRAAKFLGANSPDELAFIGNTTTAVNTILKNLDLAPEDVILCTSHNYSAVLNAADSVVTKANADLLSIDIPTPIHSEDDVIKLFEQTLSLKKAVRLAIIDHISSASAILFPVKKIAKILHDHGVLVLVDGAHGPGQADFQVKDLDADFYMGSLHKWCYCPKGTGILWVHPKHHEMIRPLVVSHFYKRSFKEEFYMQGTSDLTRYNAFPKAIDFYESIGGRKSIVDYVTPLLDWAVDMMCEALGTQPQEIPKDMRAPNMRVIGFPDLCKEDGVTICGFPDLSEAEGVGPSHNHANQMTLEIARDYQAVTCLMHFNGKYWLRLSANIYNCKEDYLRLRDVIVKFIDEKRRRSHIKT